MNDLLKQAQMHARRCEYWARQSSRVGPHSKVFGAAERRMSDSCRNLSAFHAHRAFALAAQAARS